MNNGALKVGLKMGAWDLIMQAGPTVKLVLLILIAFSVVSWAIILTKKLHLTRMRLANLGFLDLFWKAPSLESIYAEIEKFHSSSLAQVFKAGYQEIQRLAQSPMASKEDVKRSAMPSANAGLSGIDNVSRALRKASDNEVSQMEGRVSFLATVGSTAPFIGLFGTVWGIMNAFQNIGSTGSASLAVVAPGISESLITTAVGLAAAIPAVIAYNYFVGKFRKEDLDISNFNSDFLNIVKRNFFKD
jgi:biopolymer transport protein TolQ